jgi:putative protease
MVPELLSPAGSLKNMRYALAYGADAIYASSISGSQQLVGEVIEKNSDGRLLIDVKNKFITGDTLEIITPKGNHTFQLNEMKNDSGVEINDAKGSGHKVWIRTPVSMDDAEEFCILMRHLPTGQTTRSGFKCSEDILFNEVN